MELVCSTIILPLRYHTSYISYDLIKQKCTTLSTTVAQIIVHTDSNYFQTITLEFEFSTNYM